MRPAEDLIPGKADKKWRIGENSGGKLGLARGPAIPQNSLIETFEYEEYCFA
jgi:hypothetical protein